MNRRKRTASIILLALIAGIAAYYFDPGKTANRMKAEDDASGSSNKVNPGQATNPMIAYLSAFRTPIEFYGKVVNQHGDPVEGATVTLTLHDDPNPANEEASTKITLESDQEGKFSVKDLKGLSLSVRAKKEGYLTIPDLGFENPASSRLIEYGGTSDQGARFKDPAEPTLFTLHEIGPVEPMVHVKRKRWKLPLNGNPVRIALDSEEGTGQHWIEFRFTTDRVTRLEKGGAFYAPFDWKLEARIPGGGFLKNDSDYNFEAPEGGYRETIEIEYLASMAQDEWERSARRRLFVKFSDGTYGRIEFSIDGGSDRWPLYMTSWMSLKPGSRNLASPHKDGYGMPKQ